MGAVWSSAVCRRNKGVSDPSLEGDSGVPKRMLVSTATPNGTITTATQNGHHSNHAYTPPNNKVPSYVKLSCAVSGYNKYNSYASLTLANKNSDASPTKHNTIQTLNNGSPTCVGGVHCQTGVSPGSISDPRATDALRMGDMGKVNGAIEDRLGLEDDTYTHTATQNTDTRQDIQDKYEQFQSSGRTPSLDLLSERLKTLGDTDTVKDGEYFLELVSREKEKLVQLCSKLEQEDLAIDKPEEACGKIRAIIGKTTLLTTSKFKQFEGLCEKNLHPPSGDQYVPTNEDLAGFWDMVSLQVEDSLWEFQEVEEMRRNNWKEVSHRIRRSSSSASDRGEKPAPAKQTPSKAPQKTDTKAAGSGKSAKAIEAKKARDEARKKLIAAKRAGLRKRTRSRSGSEEQAIEIYIAEPPPSPR